ncbi:MAG TPA: enoyl-CoA hydratase-related protein [Casimicrobiaceae bacterium]
MGGIDVERDDRGVAMVWLDNPGHLNALSDAMILGLCEALPRLGDDASCRVIVLRGRGGVYCAGRELNDVKALQGASRDAIARIYGAMAAMNEAIYFSPVPVVSVVEKYALGIATMLVAWSDLAIAEDGAMLGYPEVRHGITPYGAIPTMLNSMNRKAMLDLLLTGRRIDAAEALRLGLLTRVVPRERLDGALDAIVDDILSGSADAIRRSKAFVRECEALGYREANALAAERHVEGIGSPAMREGVAAFLDRKKNPA